MEISNTPNHTAIKLIKLYTQPQQLKLILWTTAPNTT